MTARGDARCVLGVDIGSSAVRAALIGADGTIRVSHRVERGDGQTGLEFDTDELWRDFLAAVTTVVRGNRGSRPAGIGITSHIGTVLVDSDLVPVRGGLGWGDSTGVDLLTAALSDPTAPALEITGRPVPTGGALAAVIGLRHRSTTEFSRVRHVLSPKDFLIARMTGRATTDHTSAAYTGAGAVASRGWATGILDHVGLPASIFPEQVPSTAIVGEVQELFARASGVARGTPVVSGAPDGTAGATFVIGDDRALVADIAGTTDVLVRLLDDPGAAPRGAVVNPYTLGDCWTAGGATGTTGGGVALWSQLLGLGDAGQALASNAPQMNALAPGSDGLAIDPSVSGSRFPRWRPDDRGRVTGQTGRHLPAHFLRAAQEGAAFVVREGMDLLTGDDPATRVVIAGGAAKSSALAQLRADIFGRDVLVCTSPDVSLMGSALFAMLGLGIHSDAASALSVMRAPLRAVTHDASRADAYRTLYQDWLGRRDVVSSSGRLSERIV